jgi:uncharacterized protein HemY
MDSDPTRRSVAEHLQRAEMMYELGQVPDARAEVDAALRVDPLDPDANAMAAACALAQHDPDEPSSTPGPPSPTNPSTRGP